MKSSLPLLVQRLLAAEPNSVGWELVESELVNALLKRRKIAKSASSRPLGEPYQQMYADLNAVLTEAIHQEALAELEQWQSDAAGLAPSKASGKSQGASVSSKLTVEHLNTLLTQASQVVLTYDRLTQLAVHLQAQKFRSPDWQHALNELFNAVYLSGKLRRPKTQGSYSQDSYLDITNEVLMQAIEDIQRFDATRAHFIGWINQVYISRRSIDVLHQQQDTLKQGHHKRMMPIKYALGRILGRSQNKAARQQLIFYLRDSTQSAIKSLAYSLSFVIWFGHSGKFKTSPLRVTDYFLKWQRLSRAEPLFLKIWIFLKRTRTIASRLRR